MSLLIYQAPARVSDGDIAVYDIRAFREALYDFPEGDVVVTVQASTAAAIRSLQANKFMWVVFTVIANASDGDHTKEQIHDLMCEMFLSYDMDVVNPKTGEVTTFHVVRGTSKLKPAEHSTFVEQVMAWGAGFYGCEFPEREAA